MKRSIIFLLLVSLVVTMCGCKSGQVETNECITWIPEKSYLVSCELLPNNKVAIKYSIQFKSFVDEKCEFTLGAKFKRSETEGWLTQDTFLKGVDDNRNEMVATIEGKSECAYVFVFVGDYSGGNLPESISFPEDIIITTRFSDTVDNN